jgi:non-ribosomal peptide synthetase component F
MARFAQQDDLVLGTSFAGRERVETEGLVGCFVNILPMRANLTDRPTFLELLGRMREVTLGAYAHQNLPFERLVEELMGERRLGRNPIVQVFFGIQNALDVKLELPGLEMEAFESGYEEVRVDLSVWIWGSGDGLKGMWSYDTSLFLPQTIERMQQGFEKLLASILTDPEARVHDLELRTEAEKEELQQRAKALKQSNLERFRKAKARPAAV